MSCHVVGQTNLETALYAYIFEYFCYNFRVHRDTTHQRQVAVGFGTAFLHVE